MDEFLRSLATLINDWGWLLVFAVVLGGGDVIARVASGRRANAKLRAKLKAAEGENERLNQLFEKLLASSGGQGGGEIAALAAQARAALDDRAELLLLLGQVQATDRAWPQLPQELRRDRHHRDPAPRTRATTTSRKESEEAFMTVAR